MENMLQRLAVVIAVGASLPASAQTSGSGSADFVGGLLKVTTSGPDHTRELVQFTAPVVNRGVTSTGTTPSANWQADATGWAAATPTRDPVGISMEVFVAPATSGTRATPTRLLLRTVSAEWDLPINAASPLQLRFAEADELGDPVHGSGERNLAGPCGLSTVRLTMR